MRKFAVLSITVFASILLAGGYGIIHDQVTYTLAPEYFTRFKYGQFGLEPEWFGGHRPTVAFIGFLATWWIGGLIGIVLGLTGLMFKDYKAMRTAIQKAVQLTFCFAVISALAGFLFGKFILVKTLAENATNWYIPEGLKDRDAFITVGSIHNFSYIGGLLGLVAGVIYLVRLKRAQRSTLNEQADPS